MKKLMILTLMLVAGSSIYALDEKTETKDKHKNKYLTPDERAVRAVIHKFYTGVISGNRSRIEDAWAMKGGHVKFLVKDKDNKQIVKTIPISMAIDQWALHSATLASGEILLIDTVDDKVAMAKLKMKYDDKTYIEYFTLYNINGEWKIVHKAGVEQ